MPYASSFSKSSSLLSQRKRKFVFVDTTLLHIFVSQKAADICEDDVEFNPLQVTV